MWNEHCSYKSSKIHLKKLPTTGKQIQGPGKMLELLILRDNDAIVFKIEVIITRLILNRIKEQLLV